MTKRRGDFVADFETTTDPNDCRVWAWGMGNVQTAETLWDVKMGNSIESFIDAVSKGNNVVYFHNLKFDGPFILDHLFQQGYEHVGEKPRAGQFSTLISNMGAFYSISVTWENGRRTEFRDSAKKLPMTVARVAESFKLPIAKGELDYHTPRPVGHKLTPAERQYLAMDVLIIVKALRIQFAEGMTKLTVGADSLDDYKTIMRRRMFDKYFPILSENIDAEIRRAYKGGFTYADPRYKGKVLGSGRVYDVNSLYPSVMYDRVLPYGEPVYVSGKPKHTKVHPLSIFSVTFTAKLKPGHIPCIQIKGSGMFLATEYQTDIPEPVTLMCTNVDWELWNDHYDIDVDVFEGGWLFHGTTGLFTDYIDKWMQVKMNATGGLREIAKLHLNSLYGKFATNPDVTGKMPIYEDRVVKLVEGPPETRDPVYTAMGAFITAYARDVTIRAAQANYSTFAYADTDSLHLLRDDVPDNLDVDPHALGKWKDEGAFTQAIFMRPKQYTEKLADGTFSTHIAGLPKQIADKLTIADIVGGNTFSGKLVPRRVPGGIVLTETTFQVKA